MFENNVKTIIKKLINELNNKEELVNNYKSIKDNINLLSKQFNFKEDNELSDLWDKVKKWGWK